MAVLAYIQRHGVTDLSPRHEGQTQIAMNAFGIAQTMASAEYIKTEQRQQPEWGISSDLRRAEQALEISAKILNLKTLRPMPDLRNLGDDETGRQFEKRLEKAFAAILAIRQKTKTIPLVCTHRSVSAWVCKQFGYVRQEIDYHRASVVWEGGVILLDGEGARPVYKPLAENTAEDVGQPDDGTHVSGFVTAKDNIPPRECGNCKWEHGGACHHPVVTADDEIGLFYGRKRNKEGYWMIESNDCCNSFQNKILPKPTILH